MKFLDKFLSLMDRMPRLQQLEDKADSHPAVTALRGEIGRLQGNITLLTSAGVTQSRKIADLKAQLRDLRDQPEVQMLELRLEMQNELKRKLSMPNSVH